jgi:hypothetical protein
MGKKYIINIKKMHNAILISILTVYQFFEAAIFRRLNILRDDAVSANVPKK